MFRFAVKALVFASLLVLPFLAFVNRQTVVTRAHPAINVLDPDWIYFGNALMVAKGFTPRLVEHPGTPLLMLGAAALRLRHATVGPGRDLPLADAVLREPGAYLDAASLAEFALAMALIITAGVQFLRAGVALPLVLLSQLTLLSFNEIRVNFATFRPELLLAALIYLAYSLFALAHARPTRHAAWWIGGVTGAALAVKLNALPLLLAPLFFPRGVSRWRAGAATVLAFAAGTIPLWSTFGRVVHWFHFLSTTDGTYSGRPELFDPLRMARSFSHIFDFRFEHMAFLLAVPVILLATTATRKETRRITMFPLCALLVTMFLISRHPGNPDFVAIRYLVPAMAMFAAALPLAAISWQNRMVPVVALTTAFGATLWVTSHTWSPMAYWEHRWGALRDPPRFYFLSDALFTGLPKCSFIHYQHATSRMYSMRFLQTWTDFVFKKELSAAYPMERSFLPDHGWLADLNETKKDYADLQKELARGACYYVYTLKTHDNLGSPCFNPLAYLTVVDETLPNEALLYSGLPQPLPEKVLQLLRVTGVKKLPPAECFR